MRSRILVGTLIAIVAAFLVFGLGMRAGARSAYPAGWWGAGMMGGYGMGPGMMAGGYGYGYGMGRGMMGPGVAGGYGFGMMMPWMSASYRPGQTAVNFSTDDVKTWFQRSLASEGNPHVKLGAVTEKDAETITAEIVTTDKDGLVQRFVVNRHSGFIQPGEN